MPIIAYSCSSCKNIAKKFYRLVPQAPGVLVCDKCNGEMKKLLSAPSSVSKISVDNGAQARAVEIIPDIIELNQERNDKDYREED